MHRILQEFYLLYLDFVVGCKLYADIWNKSFTKYFCWVVYSTIKLPIKLDLPD